MPCAPWEHVSFPRERKKNQFSNLIWSVITRLRDPISPASIPHKLATINLTKISVSVNYLKPNTTHRTKNCKDQQTEFCKLDNKYWHFSCKYDNACPNYIVRKNSVGKPFKIKIWIDIFKNYKGLWLTKQYLAIYIEIYN